MAGPLFLYVDPWVNWDWLGRHVPLVLNDLTQHLMLAAIAVAIGLVIALPLGVVAHRVRGLRLIFLTIADVFYSIPSLALFALLVPYTGLTVTSAEIPLVGYNLMILMRNVVVGLEAVPPEVLDAADGMGYRPLARLLRVELPLALPATFAGIRVATVSTIGIITITALIGVSSLGQLINEGLIENFHTPLVVGVVLSVVLAAAADLTLVGAQRLALPWARSR